MIVNSLRTVVTMLAIEGVWTRMCSSQCLVDEDCIDDGACYARDDFQAQSPICFARCDRFPCYTGFACTEIISDGIVMSIISACLGRERQRQYVRWCATNA